MAIGPNLLLLQLQTALAKLDNTTEENRVIQLFNELDAYLRTGGKYPENWRKFADVRYDDGYRRGRVDMFKEMKNDT